MVWPVAKSERAPRGVTLTTLAEPGTKGVPLNSDTSALPSSSNAMPVGTGSASISPPRSGLGKTPGNAGKVVSNSIVPEPTSTRSSVLPPESATHSLPSGPAAKP